MKIKQIFNRLKILIFEYLFELKLTIKLIRSCSAIQFSTCKSLIDSGISRWKRRGICSNKQDLVIEINNKLIFSQQAALLSDTVGKDIINDKCNLNN